MAAAVYAGRKRLKTLLIAEEFGGQSIVSDDIQNWIGEPHISGFDLAQKMEGHARAYPDTVEVKTERVSLVRESGADFEVKTEQGGAYAAKTVIVAAGARRRKLGVPGEDAFNGKGVAYCSTCDAPLFGGKRVAVVGGGNAGLEAVRDLLPYASEVWLMERTDTLRGDAITRDEIKSNSKFRGFIFNADIKEITGDGFVTGVRYTDAATGETKERAVEGVFIEIGSVPNSEMVKGLVALDRYGQVIIDSKHGATSRPGIFAAGDVTDDPYKQNNISAGDAVKALLAAYAYLLRRDRVSADGDH